MFFSEHNMFGKRLLGDSKPNIHNVLRVIHIFYALFFNKKCISIGTHPPGKTIAKIVLNVGLISFILIASLNR